MFRFFTLVSTVGVLSVTATSAMANEKALNAFVLKMKSRGQTALSFDRINLNRKGTSINGRLIQLLGRGKKSKGPKYGQFGFLWEKDDAHSMEWFPQGITGLRSGPAGKRAWLAISWYDNEKYTPKNIQRGARISFADITHMDNVRYRHVLLVEPKVTGGFKPMVTHAGGLAYHKGYLYVAGTDEVLVFDTSKIFRAHKDGKKTKIGFRKGSKKVYAFDYRYILPLVRRYTKSQLGIKGQSRLSYASVDYTQPNAPLLVMGNYHLNKAGSTNLPRHLCRWAFLAGGRISRSPKDCLTQKLKDKAQGGASLGRTVYIAASGHKARLWVGKRSGKRFIKRKAYSWVYGAEDLHITKNRKRIWSLSEWPKKKGGNRIVFAVDLKKYRPKK